MIVRLVESARETGTEGVPDLLDPCRWSAPVSRVDSLSARERRVLVLLGIGESNRSIARRLDVSERTVKAHITRILAKLQVESRLQAGLVACAWARARAMASRPASEPAGTRAA
nr:helix-turn-helix transcriptional regulator [Streptomyces harenosi]